MEQNSLKKGFLPLAFYLLPMYLQDQGHSMNFSVSRISDSRSVLYVVHNSDCTTANNMSVRPFSTRSNFKVLKNSFNQFLRLMVYQNLQNTPLI